MAFVMLIWMTVFLNQIYNVTPEVTIYAITNSLIELTGVNKVADFRERRNQRELQGKYQSVYGI